MTDTYKLNNKIIQISLKQLIDAYAHIGHSTKQRDPVNTSFIFGTYNSNDLINLEKTFQKLEPTINIMTDAIANYESILLIAQNTSTNNINIIQPVITTKWMNGTLSNFKIIKQSNKNKSQNKLTRIPNTIVLIHANNDQTIFNEAKLYEIPIIALRDTNQSTRKTLYPIPSNNNFNTTRNFFLKLFSQASIYGYAKNILQFKHKKENSSKQNRSQNKQYIKQND